MADGSDQAGSTIGNRHRPRRRQPMAIDSVRAHGDSSAVSSAGTGLVDLRGDPAPRMFRVRRDGSEWSACINTGTTSSLCTRLFWDARAISCSPSGRGAMPNGLDYTGDSRDLCVQRMAHRERTRRERSVLCDTNHPDRGIFLIDVATGLSGMSACRTRPIADRSGENHGMRSLKISPAHASAAKASDTLSWMEASTDTVYGPQWTHPHPSFSHDEKRIAFASDRTGTTQVYVAEIESLS